MLGTTEHGDRLLLVEALRVLSAPGATTLSRAYLAGGLRPGAELPALSRRVLAAVRHLTSGTNGHARLLVDAEQRARAILAREEQGGRMR